jgi:hypothetical protein
VYYRLAMNMQPTSFWQLFLNNPEWALVIVGILTMFVIGWQAVETRRAAQASKQSIGIMERQTKAAEDAANAAKSSADSIIASERAWVMVDLEKVPGTGAVLEGTSTDGSRYIAACVRCICSNQGKTPARISEKRIRVLVTTPNEPLAVDPNLEMEIFDSTPHYLQSGQRSTEDWANTFKGELSGGNMIVIYGCIKYRHMFSDHEVQTTFGYRVTEDWKFERLTGYTKYNENT